jgi:hypothetical protein
VSFVGVGLREAALVGGGLVLGILAGLALPWGWPFKIGAGTLLTACGLWLAVGREPGSNRTFEEVFLAYLRFQRRPRVHQRHYQPTPDDDPFKVPDTFHGEEHKPPTQVEKSSSAPQETPTPEPAADGAQPAPRSDPSRPGQEAAQPDAADRPAKRGKEAGWDVGQLPALDQLARRPGWFRVKPLPLTAPMFLNLLGIALLVSLLAWVWLGGLETAWLRWTGF